LPLEGKEEEEKRRQVSTNSWVAKVSKQNDGTFNQSSWGIYFRTPSQPFSMSYSVFLLLKVPSSVKMAWTKLFRTLYARIK